nr:N-6 DNA methylase [Bacteroidota bacterium]
FYNSKTGNEITLNKNPIREFQTIDILRLIKNRLRKESDLENIQTNVDSISTISESIFNKKLWELKTIYRENYFDDTQQMIDFTIGFVSLEFYEEKAILDNSYDATKTYWTGCNDDSDEKLVSNLQMYINRLYLETDFKEFKDLIDALRIAIVGSDARPPKVPKEDVRRIYEVVDSMRPLHGAGFDLFGAVYEMFASPKEKKQFGEYFTRRHYAHLLAKLLLTTEKNYAPNKEFTILDPACGTGGFLTESFKVLKNNYEKGGTFSKQARNFLELRCLYGIDVKDQNISRTRLNMFLVGDGHTNMRRANTLRINEYPFVKSDPRITPVSEFDYIITNPPYGNGNIRAVTSAVSSSRTEIAFLCRIRDLLKPGVGKACVIQPDGTLENPTFGKFRKELLETFNIYAIVSLPKFAFAPYTKEKTYALFIEKHGIDITKTQKYPIWMYIIDNDGLANSDKRFLTKLRNNMNGWLHDEISGWVSTDGEEMSGVLETAWLKFDDAKTDGTIFLTDKGETVKLRKAGHIDIDKINKSNHYNLLPEYHLRKQAPNYVDIKEFSSELEKIRCEIGGLLNDENTSN